MKDLFAGPRYLAAGLNLILRPGVRLFVLIPLLINTLLFTAVILAGAGQLNALTDWLSAQWAWAEWLVWLLWSLFLILVLTIVFFCFALVANLIAAPFNGLLAEAVERSLGWSPDDSPFTLRRVGREIVDGLRSEARKFGYFAVRGAPLLLLFLIPLVQVFAPLFWVLFGAWVMALEYLEYPMGNHGMLFPEVRRRLRGRRSLAFGFGAAVLAMTLIPVVNFVAMPAAVAGATKLWHERIRPATGNENGQPAVASV